MSAIVRKYKIDVSDAFVDGTKLEANSNKYKFVWKPRKKHDRLNGGLRAIISAHFDPPDGKREFVSREIAGFLSKGQGENRWHGACRRKRDRPSAGADRA